MKKIFLLVFILATSVGLLIWHNKKSTGLTQNNFPKKTTTKESAKTKASSLGTLFPADVYDTFVKEFDFNGDGNEEYITFYKQKITLRGQIVEKQYLKVYFYDGTKWIVDHADEGTEGGIYLDGHDVLSFADIYGNGVPVVRITKHISGTGNYQQSYFLVWDGSKTSEIFLPHLDDIAKNFKPEAFLKKDETMAGPRLFMPQGNYIPICGNDEPECSIRNSTPNARGVIKFDLVRENGRWNYSNFKRVDY